MDKIKALDLRNKLQNYLNSFAGEHEIQVVVGNGVLTSSNVTFKVELAELADNGEAQTREISNFKKYAAILGLKPEDLGRTFESRGKTLKIIGCKPSSSKYPILAQDVNTGRHFKFPAAYVKNLLER